MLTKIRKFWEKLKTPPEFSVEYMTVIIKPTGFPDKSLDQYLGECREINVVYDEIEDTYTWEYGVGRFYEVPKHCIEEVLIIA